jgi:5-methyltetrahydropteroyltriglutamate--homocysteine methyltransferase
VQSVTEEIAGLFAAGADGVQLDEPRMQVRPEAAEAHGREAVRAALEGAAGTVALHICCDSAAIIRTRPTGHSVLPQLKGLLLQRGVARDGAVEGVDAEKVIAAPDCGFNDLPRDAAFGKMRAMAQRAAIVRAELG